MLSEETRIAILQMHERGSGLRFIARALNVGRATIRKVLASGSPEVPALNRPSQADPWHEEILREHARLKGRLVLVHRTLASRGATLSYQALTAYCRRHGIGVKPNRFSQSFLIAEWSEVVDAWQLESWEAYRDVKRLGRKTRLSDPQRALLWSIFERVRARLSAEGLMTQAGMFRKLGEEVSKRKKPPFDFVIVDECQDVSIPQLRFLAALVSERENGLFFAGDLGQRIFQQPFSWKGLGVDIRGRSRTLHVNYRNFSPDPDAG